MKGELESYCIGCRWWSKGNIDGTVPKIQRVEKMKKGQNEYCWGAREILMVLWVEQREKNNGGENKYCWGAKEILFPFSVEQREH